jgi:hypothetical protein
MSSVVPTYVSFTFQLPPHIGLLVAAFTHINEPDSIYGITLANEVIDTNFICIYYLLFWACSYCIYELRLFFKWHFTVASLRELDTRRKIVMGIISIHHHVGYNLL